VRDTIFNELNAQNNKNIQVTSNFLDLIQGKMVFHVRKTKNGYWEWQKINDFDRMEKFSDDEALKNAQG